MYSCFKIKKVSQSGFTLIETLLATAMLATVTLGVVYVGKQTVANSANYQSRIGAQSLRQSINQTLSNSLTCTSQFLPVPNQTPISPGSDYTVAIPRMPSTSFMSGTGFIKCIPTTLSGRLVTEPILVILIELVLLAKIA